MIMSFQCSVTKLLGPGIHEDVTTHVSITAERVYTLMATWLSKGRIPLQSRRQVLEEHRSTMWILSRLNSQRATFLVPPENLLPSSPNPPPHPNLCEAFLNMLRSSNILLTCISSLHFSLPLLGSGDCDELSHLKCFLSSCIPGGFNPPPPPSILLHLLCTHLLNLYLITVVLSVSPSPLLCLFSKAYSKTLPSTSSMQ